MTQLRRVGWMSVLLTLWASILIVGCGQDHKGHEHAKGKKDPLKKVEEDDHSEWWCAPHGIPEDICGLCNKEYRDKKKAEGDWCDMHKRVKSQCFKCDPTLYVKVFEPMYVAKYNKKPERPPEKEFQK